MNYKWYLDSAAVGSKRKLLSTEVLSGDTASGTSESTATLTYDQYGNLASKTVSAHGVAPTKSRCINQRRTATSWPRKRIQPGM